MNTITFVNQGGVSLLNAYIKYSLFILTVLVLCNIYKAGINVGKHWVPESMQRADSLINNNTWNNGITDSISINAVRYLINERYSFHSSSE